MNVLRIKETCLYVEDLERCQSFYTDKLGLKVISFVPGRHVFFQAGQSVLLCFIASATKAEQNLPPHGATGSIHFAFEVEPPAYEQTRQSMVDAGISILQDQVWKNGLRSFYFHDPDGHLLEVIEEGLWERV